MDSHLPGGGVARIRFLVLFGVSGPDDHDDFAPGFLCLEMEQDLLRGASDDFLVQFGDLPNHGERSFSPAGCRYFS